MINTTYKAPEITVIIFYPRIKHGKGGELLLFDKQNQNF